MVEFVGRYQDLAVLRREFDSPAASLVILYGRRRVGKFTIVQHAVEQRPAVYFQATLVDDALNLTAFKNEIARAFEADPVLDGVGDWLGVFHYLARRAETDKGLIVTLDEFPYLVGGNGALPSILQKFWDSKAAEKGGLKIVLCGSLIAQMEDLLAERNPLYGRKTLSREILPMPLREAAEFVPHWSPADQIMLFAILGGVPQYLSHCDPDKSLAENVERLFLAPSAPLQDEPEFLLRSEVNEPRRYSSIIAAIADGATKPSEIVSRVPGLKDATQVSPYVARLMQMRFIGRYRPIGADEHARNYSYYIRDPLFRFWHRFVRPNLSSLSRGFGAEVWARSIQPLMNDYMGPAFEAIARDHVRDYAQERLAVPAREVGRDVGPGYEIDIAGRLLDGSAVFGECKWENAIVGEAIRKRLEEAIEKSEYARDAKARHLMYFARKGFSEDLKKAAQIDRSIQLVDLEELVRPPHPEPRDLPAFHP